MICKEICKRSNKKCSNKECKYFIEYAEDLNCSLISIDTNGAMTLEEVGERMNVTPVRIKQIEDRALEKLKLKDLEIC